MNQEAAPEPAIRFRWGWLTVSLLVLLVVAGTWTTFQMFRESKVVVLDESRRDDGGLITHRVVAQHHVEDFGQPIVQFESVFWEPRDTESLRQSIRDTPLVRGKSVLEIGTGTGLVALCCLQAGARQVVATDVNPAAISNARYNASALGLEDRLETRLVPLDRTGAFSVIGESERFDLIISNPPWEDRRPANIAEYALYDEKFLLLESILSGLKQHLEPEGVALLAYGCTDAVRQTQMLADRNKLTLTIKDDRQLENLPTVFLPGMMLEVR